MRKKKRQNDPPVAGRSAAKFLAWPLLPFALQRRHLDSIQPWRRSRERQLKRKRIKFIAALFVPRKRLQVPRKRLQKRTAQSTCGSIVKETRRATLSRLRQVRDKSMVFWEAHQAPRHIPFPFPLQTLRRHLVEWIL